MPEVDTVYHLRLSVYKPNLMPWVPYIVNMYFHYYKKVLCLYLVLAFTSVLHILTLSELDLS